MTDSLRGIEDVPRMPAERWADQPREVWRAVERDCWRGWPGRVRYLSRTEVGTVVPVDWLTRERGQQGEALDLPVGRLFTAHALARRSR
jgi:hypothetical protein